jgi:hypothetical protein
MGSNPEMVIIIGVVFIFLSIVLMLLWLILPFAVFGSKTKLKEIISESQKTNTWLEELMTQNQKVISQLSDILSESKRSTAWLSEMKAAPAPVEEPTTPADITVTDTRSSENNEIPSDDKRKYPRLDFQCTGMVMGQDAVITDISLGGIFLELDEVPELLKVGKVTNVDMDLPTEARTVRMKIKVISQNDKGVGCKFIDLSLDNTRALQNCFDEFKNTLPIRYLEEV